MKFYRLTDREDPLYQRAFQLYNASFPEHEQRSVEDHERAMKDPAFHSDIVLEEEKMIGILFHWDFNRYSYLEHFAVDPGLRGNAYGSRIMEKYCAQHELVILEIDPPVDEISIRRERFYANLGFHESAHPHKHPAYRRPYQPHELVLMSYPNDLSEDGFLGFQLDLQEKVMQYAEASHRVQPL